ncbi:MAG: PEGA domain-containing protein [Blastocatellia bacterium]
MKKSRGPSGKKSGKQPDPEDCQILLDEKQQELFPGTFNVDPKSSPHYSLFFSSLRLLGVVLLLVILVWAGRYGISPVSGSKASMGSGPAADKVVSVAANAAAGTVPRAVQVSESIPETGADEKPEKDQVAGGKVMSKANKNTAINRVVFPPTSGGSGAVTQMEADEGKPRQGARHDPMPETPRAETDVAEGNNTEHGVEIRLDPPDKDLNKSTGSVSINSYSRAYIYIDGQFSGATPRVVRLLAGDHVITLRADGFDDWTRKVSLHGRQQVGLMASMSRR